MLDKKEFYHGVALIRMVEDVRCQSVKKYGTGFLVNEDVFVYLKYRTKNRTPWSFQFGSDEIAYLLSAETEHARTVIGFVCGGDGICGLDWTQAKELLANSPGSISCARRFNEQYAVSGTNGKMKGKVSLQQWPALVFEN